MEKNKTAKYFKYALGEIILVVIGILIALQINNLNQKSQEKDQLDASLILMQLNLKEALKRLHLSNHLKNRRQQKIPLHNIGNLAKEKSFYSVSTALKSMESGGYFKWIQDNKLKELILYLLFF